MFGKSEFGVLWLPLVIIGGAAAGYEYGSSDSIAVLFAALFFALTIVVFRAVATGIDVLDERSQKNHADLLEYIDKLDSKLARNLETILIDLSSEETQERRWYLLSVRMARYDHQLEQQRIFREDSAGRLNLEKMEKLEEANDNRLKERLAWAKEELVEAEEKSKSRKK